MNFFAEKLKFAHNVGKGEIEELIAYNILPTWNDGKLQDDPDRRQWTFDRVIEIEGPLEPTDPIYGDPATVYLLKKDY